MSNEGNAPEGKAVPVPEKRLGEEVLLDYVNGAVDAPTALLVTTYLALNPDAREMVDVMRVAGGTLLEQTPPVAMASGALDAVLARIEAGDDIAAGSGGADVAAASSGAGDTAHALPDGDDLAVLPDAVRRRVQTHGGKWAFVSPGVRSLDLGFEPPVGKAGSAPGEVKLYRIKPGRSVLGHTHKGNEITLVLTGAFVDDRGRFGAGEICAATPDIAHRPAAEQGGACYALTITDAPLQLTGVLGRVQRALGLAD